MLNGRIKQNYSIAKSCQYVKIVFIFAFYNSTSVKKKRERERKTRLLIVPKYNTLVHKYVFQNSLSQYFGKPDMYQETAEPCQVRLGIPSRLSISNGDLYVLSHVRRFVTPWTVACQAPLSTEFARQANWSRCHFLLQMVTWGQEYSCDIKCCGEACITCECSFQDVGSCGMLPLRVARKGKPRASG